MESKNTTVHHNSSHEDFNEHFINVLCQEGTESEKMQFKEICAKTGLDPLIKQIYPVFRYNSSLNRKVMTVQTSIDGYRLIAERTQKYSPGKESTFTYGSDNSIVSATAYVKKMTPDGTWHEVASTAYWAEYCQVDKKGNVANFWKKMPHVMLSKCAEAQALRKAFPGEFTSIYTADEMMQADTEPSTTNHSEFEDKIEEILKDFPSLRERILKGYKKNKFSEIDEKEHAVILKNVYKRIEDGEVA
jgi:phage recombination protein Bet